MQEIGFSLFPLTVPLSPAAFFEAERLKIEVKTWKCRNRV